jgi:phage repressor protein C with HTH and peptisase S24 domain
MNSIVTKRFIECHQLLLKEKKVRSSRQFAQALDFLPQSLNEILKCRRDVTIDLLHKSILKYRFNPEYLFAGEGKMVLDDTPKNNVKVLCIVTDQQNNERITYVPVPAQAGYPQMNEEPTFIHDLPTFSLPDLKYQSGTYRAFDVSGDSMEPTLFEGDKVVCSFFEQNNWENNIKNTYIYVVVTQNNIFLKRLSYHKDKPNTIILTSDNSYYDPFPLHLSEIKEMWYVRTRISPFLPSPQNVDRAFKEEMLALKNQMTDQTKLIESLYRTIESLMPFKK